MSITRINSKSAINLESVKAIYNREDVGISYLSGTLALLGFIESSDIDDSSEMIKLSVEKILKSDTKNKVIKFKNNSLIHIDLIGAMNVSGNKLVISSKDNKVLLWQETDSEEEAELMCNEVITAYEYAEKGKRYNIDWEILNTDTESESESESNTDTDTDTVSYTA